MRFISRFSVTGRLIPHAVAGATAGTNRNPQRQLGITLLLHQLSNLGRGGVGEVDDGRGLLSRAHSSPPKRCVWLLMLSGEQVNMARISVFEGREGPHRHFGGGYALHN